MRPAVGNEDTGRRDMMPPVMDRFRPPQPMSKSAIIERREQLQETREEYLDKIKDIDAKLEDLNTELI
jgi:hypothetical protein